MSIAHTPFLIAKHTTLYVIWEYTYTNMYLSIHIMQKEKQQTTHTHVRENQTKSMGIEFYISFQETNNNKKIDTILYWYS